MSAVPQPAEPPVPVGAPVLEVRGVTKRFGALAVLRGIDLVLRQGEVLGLVGDNGAGKSTLVKILSGFHAQDGGELLLEGERVSFNSVEAARSHGIETVYQDLALIPQLPVYQNLFLGHEVTRFGPIRFLDKREMRKLARQYLDDINVNVPSVDAEADGALRRPAAGDRGRPGRARGAQDPAARRAARGDGGARVTSHHQPRQGPRLERPSLDHRDRPQLRSPLRAVRPHQRHARRPHHDRPAGARDVAGGAHGADGLELPSPNRGGAERRRAEPGPQ